MQMIAEGYRGMSLMFELNIDRLLVPLALIVALSGMAMLATTLYERDLPPQEYMHQP
jgi:hypothetical protein